MGAAGVWGVTRDSNLPQRHRGQGETGGKERLTTEYTETVYQIQKTAILASVRFNEQD